MGANRPIHEIAASEGLTQPEYEAIAANPQFQRYLESYARELQENGFSIQAKSRLLAEDLLPTMYHLARDPDAPAAARVKIFENFVELADAKPKQAAVAPGAGFSITINIPKMGDKPAEIITFDAETAQKPVEIAKSATPTQKQPILLAEADDYEYAGDDYL